MLAAATYAAYFGGMTPLSPPLKSAYGTSDVSLRRLRLRGNEQCILTVSRLAIMILLILTVYNFGDSACTIKQ